MRNVWCLRIHVTLEAQESSFPSQQKHSVYRSVRGMARCAAFRLYGRVFKNKGAALFRVALDADLPVRVAEHHLIAGSMRIVAIRAFHQSFGDAMMRGQSVLGLYRFVALITKVRLRLAQKPGLQPPGFLGRTYRHENLSLCPNGGIPFDRTEPCQMRRVTRLTVDSAQLVL